MKKATIEGGNKVLEEEEEEEEGNKVLEEEEEAGNRNRSRVLGTRTPPQNLTCA